MSSLALQDTPDGRAGPGLGQMSDSSQSCSCVTGGALGTDIRTEMSRGMHRGSGGVVKRMVPRH